MSIESMDLTLPRNAFSARDAARAGDVWRAFQDAAVVGSIRRGWPPRRFVEEQCAFVVREQTVLHRRELRFGETVHAKTWVERFRRETFTTRQIRFEVEGQPVADATQEWVHVQMDGVMRAARASASLIASFPEQPQGALVQLPAITTVLQAPEHTFSFDAWFTWMDPLDHANHPAYVDWCDEALSRVLHRHGGSPLTLKPVAERVRYRTGVLGMDPVQITFRMVGLAGELPVIDFKIRTDRRCAEARLVRTLSTGPAVLRRALEAD